MIEPVSLNTKTAHSADQLHVSENMQLPLSPVFLLCPPGKCRLSVLLSSLQPPDRTDFDLLISLQGPTSHPKPLTSFLWLWRDAMSKDTTHTQLVQGSTQIKYGKQQNSRRQRCFSPIIIFPTLKAIFTNSKAAFIDVFPPRGSGKSCIWLTY